MGRLALLIALSLAAWAAQAGCLMQLGRISATAPSRLIVPRPAMARLVVTDFQNMAADALWIQALVHNGEQLAKPKGVPRDFDGLAEAFELVTDFDPRFHEASLFGSWALSDAERVAPAEQLLVKGMQRFPTMWQYPFQLGFIEFLYGHQLGAAADHFMQASRLPGCPPGAAHMAAGLYRQGNQTELAIATWRSIYLRGDDRIKGIARRALGRLGVTLTD